MHTDQLPLHGGEHAFNGGGLTTAHYDPVIEAPAVGDLSGDGELDVVADDVQGNVYAWNAKGEQIFHETSNPAYSGAPLAGDPAWAAQRDGVRQRTEGGFATSPVLADLEGEKGHGLDIIAAGEDRHVYAWHADGEAVKGFPVLVEDPDKLASVDPVSNQPTFNANVPADQNKDEDQGKIVDTPAVAQLDGPGKPPSIIVGTNEEYLAGQGDEGELNASGVNTASLGAVGASGLLTFANGRVYAINASGCSSDPSSCATGGLKCESAKCTASDFREGWPAKIGIIDAGLLPDVGEGINGSPVVAPVLCPEGGEGLKVGVTPGRRARLRAQRQRHVLLRLGRRQVHRAADRRQREREQNRHADLPGRRRAGVRHARRHDDEHVRADLGLLRALDVVAPDYQKGSQDFIAGWNANSGQYSPGFPAVDNDLSFITGETVGDVTGEAPKQEVLAGTASQDLRGLQRRRRPRQQRLAEAHRRLDGRHSRARLAGHASTPTRAPRRTSSRSRAKAPCRSTPPPPRPARRARGRTSTTTSPTPATTRATRSRPASRCNTSVSESTLHFTAPGDDLLCGKATRYEIVTSESPITAQNFASATPLSGAPNRPRRAPRRPMRCPRASRPTWRIRAIDDQGNIGLPASAEYNPGAPLPALGRCVKARREENRRMARRALRRLCPRQRRLQLPARPRRSRQAHRLARPDRAGNRRQSQDHLQLGHWHGRILGLAEAHDHADADRLRTREHARAVPERRLRLGPDHDQRAGRLLRVHLERQTAVGRRRPRAAKVRLRLSNARPLRCPAKNS